MLLRSFLVPRIASRDCAIGATFGQPICLLDNLWSQLNTPFSDIQTFVVNPALPADDIQVATGDSGRHEPPLQIDRFLETAEAAAITKLVPFRHCCGNSTIMRFW